VANFPAILTAWFFISLPPGDASSGNGTAIMVATDAAPQVRANLSTSLAELDIFSGTPNPTWRLSDEDTARLASLIEMLPRTSASLPSIGLGYRGFVVRAANGHSGDEITIKAFRGVVQYVITGKHPVRLEDVQVQVERFLLETAKPWLDKDLGALVETEIRIFQQR
jgi:hypothetical protein